MDLSCLFWYLGAIFSLSVCLQILHWVWQNIRPRKPLAQVYGANTWAIITGASDGIGKGFAFVLAKAGFNVCLVARNATKLEEVKRGVLERYPKTQVKIVIADFTHSLTPKFFDNICDQIKDLDISLLINNVGVGLIDHFHQSSDEKVDEALVVNMYPQVILTKRLLPQLLARAEKGPYKSGIVSISSMAGTKPVPYDVVYSCAKAFSDFFSRALSFEFRGKVDLLSVRCFYVSTKMVFNRKPGLETITPEECAEGCLKDLGIKDFTWGHYKHEAQGIAYNLVPEWVAMQGARIVCPVQMKDKEKFENQGTKL